MNNCQNCNKAPATVHLTEINPDNVPTETLLCEECAQETGASPKSGPSIAVSTTAFVSLGQPASSGGRSHTQLMCDECGMGYQEFRSVGRFGCCRCYEVFAEPLTPLLEKVHGATQYVGPQPGQSRVRVDHSIERQRELADLRRQLRRLVDAEDYEEAARVRDRIQHMEVELEQDDD